MPECDVVIPVYKSPEWVELCLYALFQNTDNDVLGKVILVNDSDDVFTKNCLENLKNKYGKKIIIKQNKQNLGFTKTANIGLRLATAEYVLLLNTDCLVSKRTIEKMINHMKADKKIGMICPISSNAANLSLDILEGFTYTQMNDLLEQRFKGMVFDACTVVGNCLMISRECIKKVGVLDEIYSPGYGEETDYQFKAMDKGFSAKIAADTYVFHKAETSFGISEKKQKMVEEHLAIFFSRWKKEYDAEMAKYSENDPVKYILDDFEKNPPKIKNSAMFYIKDIGSSGGCNVIVDIINRLAINGYQCNIIYDNILLSPEIMLFSPASIERIDEISTKKIVATLWVTAFFVRKLAIKKKWEFINFVQGLEQHFEDGRNYGFVEVSFRLSNKIVVVSRLLQKWMDDIYGIKTRLIENGINLELVKKKRKNKKIRTILLVTRNDYRKCNYVLCDVLRKLDRFFNNIAVNIVVTDEDFALPLLDNKKNKYNIIDGPLARTKIFELLQESDIYVDASYSEGFGLTALEAMAAGCIPIASDSFGVRDYLVDGVNGIMVKEINDADVYLEKIKDLMKDDNLRKKIYAGMEKTVKEHDFNDRIVDYASVFAGDNNPSSKSLKALNPEEEKINKKILRIFYADKFKKEGKKAAEATVSYSKKQLVARKAAKILPKPIRATLIKAVEFLKSCYS